MGNPETPSLALSKVQIGFESRLSAFDVQMAHAPELMVQDHMDEVIFSLKAYLVKPDDPHVIYEHFEVPATWQDHFKQTHFPRWLLKVFPVKTITKLVTRTEETRMCPHIQFPHNEACMRFLSFGETAKDTSA